MSFRPHRNTDTFIISVVLKGENESGKNDDMMTENLEEKTLTITSSSLNELKKLVWGSAGLRSDVFVRWAQGYVFSEDEPTALVQFEGGPCAVIAPVQGFLLKNLMFGNEGEWRAPSDCCKMSALATALGDILAQCGSSTFRLVFYEDRGPTAEKLQIDLGSAESFQTQSSSSKSEDLKTEQERFHSFLQLIEVHSCQEAIEVYKQRTGTLNQQYAVLSYLYSVLLTKGIDQVKNEMEDPSEPLIDGIHGHGSQSLINLMLTGRAVSNVWDNDKDISGLKLQGINKQATIGFLTLMEHLRYCEVGWFLKCPLYPIWVLGSETHLTVLFTQEQSLCSPETPEGAARRIFKSFDPEGNNFISAVLLGDVLYALGLYAESEYVEMMVKKLDPESLGVILLSDFLDEFYPNKRKSVVPEQFVFYHFNGLSRSNAAGKITYHEGNAIIVDFMMKCTGDSSPVTTCIQTKWPGLDVEWTGGLSPSLN